MFDSLYGSLYSHLFFSMPISILIVLENRCQLLFVLFFFGSVLLNTYISSFFVWSKFILAKSFITLFLSKAFSSPIMMMIITCKIALILGGYQVYYKTPLIVLSCSVATWCVYAMKIPRRILANNCQDPKHAIYL